MSDWKRGYDDDTIAAAVDRFSAYNALCVGEFARMSPPRVVEAMHKGEVVEVGSAALVKRKLARNVSIKMFGSGDPLVVADKRRGEVDVKAIAVTSDAFDAELRGFDGWVEAHAHDAETRAALDRAGFERVGFRVTSMSDIFSIWYRGPRRIVPPPAVHGTAIKKVFDVDVSLIEAIASKLDRLPAFTDHYSNYNVKHTWSALSLRGFFADPGRIEDPEEVGGDDLGELQWTRLAEDFPEVRSLVELLPSYGVERVRFMKLTAGGVLERHTDIVDEKGGLRLGQLARFHFPIVTNDRVTFTQWTADGERVDVHPAVGECWFLNARFPHRAENLGDADRVHLVVDVNTTRDILNLLEHQ